VLPLKGDPDRLAARWFTEAERCVFAADPTAAQFLRIWTRKEAMVKYTGEGLRALACADSENVALRGLRLCAYETDGALLTLCTLPEAHLPRSPVLLSWDALSKRISEHTK
jgi:hypothetical protein